MCRLDVLDWLAVEIHFDPSSRCLFASLWGFVRNEPAVTIDNIGKSVLKSKRNSDGSLHFIRFTGSAVGPLLGAAFYEVGGNHALYISLFLFLFTAAAVIHKNMDDPLGTPRVPREYRA
jgi:hypothetical protein